MKYCSRDCQVAHHPNHKKLCWQRNAELFNVELFKDSPEGRECPICMLPLPFNYSQAYFYACCGKTLCVGCVYAQKKEVISKGKDKMVCAFCRTPPPKSEKEVIDRLKIGVERNDAKSMQQLAVHYLNGEMGLQKDLVKAIEMYQKAGKHGCASAYGILPVTKHSFVTQNLPAREWKRIIRKQDSAGNLPLLEDARFQDTLLLVWKWATGTM